MTVFDPYGSDMRPRDFTARLPRRVPGTASRRRRRHAGRRALALLAGLAVPALAAPADWQAFAVGNAGRAEVQVQPMPFERPGDSFPGSAFYYIAPDAPVAGGLSDNPDGPTGGYAGAAAQALHLAGSMTDRDRALTCLTQAIYYEAASEPDNGQRAVAQVVLNRVAHPAFPKTVCGVVYQGSERGTGCQFTFTCDGSLARVHSRLFWQRSENIARAALAGYVYTPVGLATHYHTIAVHPYWESTLNYLLTIGAHRFYSLAGPAGSPSAFHAAAYIGGEPAAAPRPRTGGPLLGPDPSLDPVAIERAFGSGVKVSQSVSGATSGPAHAMPSYAPEIEARGGDSLYRADRLPETQGIRPEYQESGRWISQPGT